MPPPYDRRHKSMLQTVRLSVCLSVALPLQTHSIGGSMVCPRPTAIGEAYPSLHDTLFKT